MKLALIVASAFALVTTAGLAARADIPPPNSSQCRDQQGGAACELEGGGAGVCEVQTCARALPGGVSEYDCTICVPAPAKPAEAAPATEPVATKTSSKCAGGGADLVLAFGAALGFVFRRRRTT